MFYIIIDGQASAEKTIDGEVKPVMQYKAGDYFGEVALLKNENRQATIIAKTAVSVVYLD